MHHVNKSCYAAIKRVKGATDFAIVYKVTAVYTLKINKVTLQVKEQCQLLFDTVTVLGGTTIAWANSQRVGKPGCLSQEKRADIAEIVRYFPKRCMFHLSAIGSEEQRLALALTTPPLLGLDEGYTPNDEEQAQLVAQEQLEAAFSNDNDDMSVGVDEFLGF